MRSAADAATVPLRRPQSLLVTSEDRIGFRLDVEGMRALAILPVLFFHAQVPHMTGGFVGVDIFFVISGFLITGLLVQEADQTGRVGLLNFYARRARRILPAAGVVLTAVTVACWLLLPPLRQVTTIRDVAAASVYVANWRFISQQTDYMASGREPSPVLHYWSLSAEEQFYLVWPLLLLAAALLARRVGRPVSVFAVPVTLGVIVGSLALSLHWTAVTQPVAYMSSPSRAWQFALGALLALATPALLELSRGAAVTGIRIILGWAGCAAIVWSVLTYDRSTAYPGTAALVPTLGAVAIIAAGTGVPPRHLCVRAGAGRLLGSRPARAIGRRSFSWYLWHWALLVLVQASVGELTWPGRAAVVAAAAVPAELTMRLVEQPIRFSAVVSTRWSRGLAVGLTATLLPIATAMLIGTDALRGMRGGNEDSVAILPHLPPATQVRDPFAQPGGTTSGPVTPPPWVAYDDIPHFPEECVVAPPQKSSPPCLVQTAGSVGRVVLLGDSHAAQWFGAVSQVARKNRWSVEILTKVGCPLSKISVRNEQLGRTFTECDSWREGVLRRLLSTPPPEIIFISALNRYDNDQRHVLEGWRKTILSLADLHIPIVYLRDTPDPPQDIPACISGAIADWTECSFPRAAAMPPDPLATAVRAATLPGVHLVDLNHILCPDPAPCPAVRGSVLLYRDDSHLTDTAATLLGPALEDALVTDGQIMPKPGIAAAQDTPVTQSTQSTQSTVDAAPR